MSRWDTRCLKAIEQNLDAQETMVLWLEEARQQHDTLDDLVRSLKGQPEGAWPLYVLTERVGKTRTPDRLSLSPDAPGEIYAGVRDAVRDVAALYYLFAGVMRECRAMWLSLLLLAHALTAWSKGALRPKAPPIAQQVRGYLRDLAVWFQVAETIGERRYQATTYCYVDRERSWTTSGRTPSTSWHASTTTSTSSRGRSRRAASEDRGCHGRSNGTTFAPSSVRKRVPRSAC